MVLYVCKPRCLVVKGYSVGQAFYLSDHQVHVTDASGKAGSEPRPPDMAVQTSHHSPRF